MATQKDLYAVLGVSKTATVDEIRKSYRKLARQHHPDLNAGNKQAEERFKEVSQAYDVLSDAEKRKLYDEFGADALQPNFDASRAREYKRWAESGGGFRFQGGQGGGFEGFDFRPGAGGRTRRRSAEDERGFADILNEMFGGGTAPHTTPAGGQDIEYPIEVDFLDALRGTKTAVTVRRPQPCPQCDGTGRQGRRACTRCGGSGSVEVREKLTVKIPAGVGDGARVRVAGKGGAGANGGRAGDLYFVVTVRSHPLLTRDGKDLTVEVPVTVGEAMYGATITVPTPLGGRVQLKIPRGSQGGQRLRLKGRGVPDLKGGDAGDLYVRLMVQVPVPPPNGERKDAVEVIEKSYAGDPRANLTF